MMLAMLLVLVGGDATVASAGVSEPRDDRRVTLMLEATELRDVLRFFQQEFGVNYVIDHSVPARVPITCALDNVPWRDALGAILRSAGLGATDQLDELSIEPVVWVQRAERRVRQRRYRA